MTVKMLTKVTLTTFNPKHHNEALNKNGRVLLGSIVGIASKIVTAKGADGISEFEGIAGDFAIIFPNGDQARSGKAFLPDAFMEPVLAALRDETDPETGEVIKAGATRLDFAYDVSIIRADNPAGYSWELEPKMAPSESDPLADLLKLAAPKTDAVKAVEDKSGK